MIKRCVGCGRWHDGIVQRGDSACNKGDKTNFCEECTGIWPTMGIGHLGGKCMPPQSLFETERC